MAHQFKVGDRVRLTQQAVSALSRATVSAFGETRVISKLEDRSCFREDPLAWFEGMGSHTLDVGWLEPAPALIDRCIRTLRVPTRDEVRAGVDAHLDMDPTGPVITGILQLLRGARV